MTSTPEQVKVILEGIEKIEGLIQLFVEVLENEDTATSVTLNGETASP
jgi:hypothetical protein